MTAVTDPLIAQLVGARKAAGLSQSQLAAIMYISRGTLGQLERGRHSPRLATLRPWAQALGLQPALVPLAYGPARDDLDDALADPCDCSAHEEFRRQLQDPAVAAEWMRARVARALAEAPPGDDLVEVAARAEYHFDAADAETHGLEPIAWEQALTRVRDFYLARARAGLAAAAAYETAPAVSEFAAGNGAPRRGKGPADEDAPASDPADVGSDEGRADVARCERCPKGSTGTCCSSHGKLLCHECYRRTHFVEVCDVWCEYCIAEGLPKILPPRSAVARTLDVAEATADKARAVGLARETAS